MLKSSVRPLASGHRGLTGLGVGLVVAATVAGGGVALAAIPSSSTSQYTGCVAKQNGAVRIVDFQAGKRCTAKEKTISWSKGWRYRGTWSASFAYAVGDVVVQNGSSYLAKVRSTGKTPSGNASVWGLLAQSGTAGAVGPAGPAGPAGPVGQQGATGPEGPGLDLVYVRTGPHSVDPGATEVDLFCADGLSAIWGGVSNSSDLNVELRGSLPIADNMLIPGADDDTIPDNGWAIQLYNSGAGVSGIVAFYAVCGSASTVSQDVVTVTAAPANPTSRSSGAKLYIARPR